MYHCIGCNTPIPWDGKSFFSYTCKCGSTTFINNETNMPVFTASVTLAISRALASSEAKPNAHLDYIVGTSSYTSPEKEQLTGELIRLGFIWMKDCPQCQKDGTLARFEIRQKIDNHRKEVHARVDAGELTSEESVIEMVEYQKQLRQGATK